MPDCLVIADDLTGGNATGVLLQKRGYTSCTVLTGPDERGVQMAGYTCLIYPTNSRALPAAAAYERVYQAARLCRNEGIRLYAKRIDSTLRGNVGAEIDAMLDVLGDGYAAAVIPAFPASGRVVKEGVLFVHGIKLAQTEAARDPLNPVCTSRVAEIVGAQSQRASVSVCQDSAVWRPQVLAAYLRYQFQQGIRLFFFDAGSEADLDFIAGQLIESGIPFLSADPGPLSAALTARLLPAACLPAQGKSLPPDPAAPAAGAKRAASASWQTDTKEKPQQRGRVLAVVGSVNDVARRQFDAFMKEYQPDTVFLHTRNLLESEESRAAEIVRASTQLVWLMKHGATILALAGDGIYEQGRIDLARYAAAHGSTLADLSRQINDAFADVVEQTLRCGGPLSGLYLSGGDITLAVCRALGIRAIGLHDEVVPLAALGQAVGGDYGGRMLVTKGGMVGQPDAMCTCIHRLLSVSWE